MAKGLCIVKDCNQVEWHIIHRKPYGTMMASDRLSHAFVGATVVIAPADENLEQKVSELGPVGPTDHVRDRVTGSSGRFPSITVNMHTPVTIKEWQIACYENSKAHGFHQSAIYSPDLLLEQIAKFERLLIAEKLALIHSEVSEALEDLRDGKMEEEITHLDKPIGFPSELADIVIRVLDLSGMLGIDLEGAMRRKHEYNKSRPYKHGKKF